jgi:hypothetical protein
MLTIIAASPSTAVAQDTMCPDRGTIYDGIDQAIRALEAGAITAEEFDRRIRESAGASECYQQVVLECEGDDCPTD